MPVSVFISHTGADDVHAAFFDARLVSDGFTVHTSSDFPVGSKQDTDRTRHIKLSNALIALLSPSSVRSEAMMRECTLAQFHNKLVIPVITQPIDRLPPYFGDALPIDAHSNIGNAYDAIASILPQPTTSLTFGNAKDTYLQRATLKSAHTIDAYRRAIEHFFEFLEDRSNKNLLPIQQLRFTIADELPLARLSDSDTPLFLHFAQWLLSPSSGRTDDRRPYKESTVELRVSGIQNWFQYLDDYGWLPSDFPLSKARRMVRDELRNKTASFSAPRPPEHIEEVIYYYDHQQPPKRLQKPDADAERVRRWNLTRLRNRALMHSLAETGGRISEVLSLDIADFPVRYLKKQEVLRVPVVGKGGHDYYLRFYDALPAISAYIDARGADLKASPSGKVPLFVSHDPRYDGNRMSRVVAWRMVQRAAKALGLGNITPHDFRHWRATQLINAGHSLDVVQDYLGHRSVETTRAYYAHTDPLRVDDAAKNTPLPDLDSDEY